MTCDPSNQLSVRDYTMDEVMASAPIKTGLVTIPWSSYFERVATNSEYCSHFWIALQFADQATNDLYFEMSFTEGGDFG